MKTYLVEGANWKKEVEIDESNYGKDVYLEAATRALEWAFDNADGFNLGLIVSVKDVDDDDEGNIVMITSYMVLINAGKYELAESMRQSILASEGIDIKPKTM